MVWPVQGIYRLHTARLGLPGRCHGSPGTSHSAYKKHSTRAHENAFPRGLQRSGLRSGGHILRCYDRTGNLRGKINRSSETRFPEELDTAVAIRRGILPQTPARVDPKNYKSLFEEFHLYCPYPRAARSFRRALGIFQRIRFCASKLGNSKNDFLSTRTDVRFSGKTGILL